MPRGKPTPVVNRSIAIPYDIMEKLKEMAAKEGTSVSALMVEAIKKFIEEGGKDED